MAPGSYGVISGTGSEMTYSKVRIGYGLRRALSDPLSHEEKVLPVLSVPSWALPGITACHHIFSFLSIKQFFLNEPEASPA